MSEFFSNNPEIYFKKSSRRDFIRQATAKKLDLLSTAAIVSNVAATVVDRAEAIVGVQPINPSIISTSEEQGSKLGAIAIIAATTLKNEELQPFSRRQAALSTSLWTIAHTVKK